ncbi:MAG: hypothetical protein DRQ40_04490 [Gammaproteobacteria bacterium]|nr:MAG: hypothetical protein DRQ40_04490 [Gammaproteobacteria bacterium]
MDTAILIAEIKLREAKENLKAARMEVQKSCEHPDEEVVEGKYEPCSYANATPPFRVCKLCGYAEQGWGCGYWKLGHGLYSIPIVSRSEAFEFVSGGIIRQDQLSEVRYDRKDHDTLWEMLNQ